MPKRDDDLLILDMIECCDRIFNYVQGMDFEKFMDDSKTVDPVIRNFEVLGEASRFISVEVKSENPLVEWRKISDFRNVLIHDYFGIDHQIMWEIIMNELPVQFEILRKIEFEE